MESNWRWYAVDLGLEPGTFTMCARILSGPYEGLLLCNDLGLYGTKAIGDFDVYDNVVYFTAVEYVDDGGSFPGDWDVEPD